MNLATPWAAASGNTARARRVARGTALAGVLCILLFTLTACGQQDESPKDKSRAGVDVELLATDIHVSIAQHSLVLPFAALEEHAYQRLSFSLDRKGDRERAAQARRQFLHDSADPGHPLPLDSLSVVVNTYGWNDDGMHQRRVCPLLAREWARSVCDNPWAAAQQALPANRFRLVDLGHLQAMGPGRLASCREGTAPPRALPSAPGQAVLLCNAMVYGGRDDQHHHAVVRIDGDLGALWMVWHYGQNGESAEAMAQREGEAIASFVHHALGQHEDFARLRAGMCRLRRPGSADHPHGADCGRAAGRRAHGIDGGDGVRQSGR